MKRVVVEEHNLDFEIGNPAGPEDLPLWYEQFLKLSEKKRKFVTNKVMELIKDSNAEAFKFIRNTKCKLVGVSPRIVYSLLEASEGSLETSWIHAFSMPTLLFWCEEGKFGFFINPNLEYNDTVLNKVSGNKKNSLKGFTG